MIDKAIAATLEKGIRTGDIAAPGEKTVSTSEMGSAILAELEVLAA
jgi:3-isopropylmalate dehydrogenase